MKNKLPLNIIVIALFFQVVAFGQTPCSSGYVSNGIDDYIEIPNSTHINTNNTAVADRTIEMWFKTSDITTKQVLYDEGGGTDAFVVYIEGGSIYLGQYTSNGSNSSTRLFFRSGSGDLTTDTWYHIAYTLESGTTAKWYLNGVEQDSQTAFSVKKHTGDINVARSGGNMKYPSSLVTNWNTSSVGGSSAENYTNSLTGNINTNFYFNGSISLFRVWNVARTFSEINTNKGTYLTTGTGLVAYSSNETVYYHGNADSGPTSSVVSINSGVSYSWTGGISTVFTDDLNWSTTAPDATKAQTVIINSGATNPEITTNVKIGELTVNSGATITVKSGGTLNVYYGLTNNGTITVEDGGSLIFHTCISTISGSGTFNVSRNSPAYSGAYFFSYWSSPLIQTDADPAVIFPSNSVIYYFDASISNADWAWNGGSNFIPGVGYAIRHETTGSYTPTFSGKVNEGLISVPMYYNSNLASTDPSNVWNNAGDNLIGNPFASAIDWDLVVSDEDNSMLEGTIYLWDQTVALVGDNDVDDYKQYNITGGSTPGVTGKIGTGQGFFARATVAGTLKLKPAHQVAGENTQFFKGRNVASTNKKENRSWFSLSNGSQYSSILIGFIKNATDNYDRLYDSPFDVSNTTLGVYSIIEGDKKATIQGLPVLNEYQKIVPIGFVVDNIGTYTIKINEEYINDKYDIYLEDTELKKVVNLREINYNFSVNQIGENNNRFKIYFTQFLGINPDLITSKENYHAFVDASKELQILLKGDLFDKTIEEVKLYNISGKEVSKFMATDRRDVSGLPTAIYIVKILFDDGRAYSKKIVIAE